MSARFDHVWRWKKRLSDKTGQKCRILIRSKAGNNCLVEFEDGLRVVTSQWAVLRLGHMIQNEVSMVRNVAEEIEHN